MTDYFDVGWYVDINIGQWNKPYICTHSVDKWQPHYSKYRHGGWYVDNIRYPSGACGCVSNNYDDKKWRIVCGDHEQTFSSRDAAARAERLIAMGEVLVSDKTKV